MRFILALMAAFCCTVVTQAQLNRPMPRHKVRFAADTVFKRMPPLKTVQPTIFERALRTTAACNVSCSPLPVKFMSLKAERKTEEKVLVQWETAQEVDVERYEVERSPGDVMHFETAGFVSAQGTANALSSYTFPDANDFPGTSYYRIKQVDKDQKYSYSKTVAVKGYRKEEWIEGYPNPAPRHLQLSLTLIKGGPVTLTVFDATGRLVLQQNKTLSKGGNVFPLAVEALLPGAYFLRTATPAEKALVLHFIKN